MPARAELAVRRPFPWPTLLRYLAPRAVPGSERVEGDAYWRKVGGRWREARYDAERGALALPVLPRANRAAICAGLVRLFDPDHDAAPAETVLRRSRALRERVIATPGLRPLGAWSPFELCVRTVVGQQVTVGAASTLMRRLAQRSGGIAPDRLADADLAGIGMPARRVESLQRFAQAVADGTVPIDTGAWPEIEGRLRELPGFGPWTRAYLAIRLGREPDAFPETDIGLMRAAGASSPHELLRMAEAWRPFRAHAAAYLWLPA